ncbi:hypothetical protein E2C01_068972 [Portunus trituberculatus]|uniref:Uncharacterized protein n=1 Tax=Portunus trituberculatus TaxID=210409 RepID=A0A5B7HXN4_PORTR|nr:hypothetical protein [Portunus trituberculatus]
MQSVVQNCNYILQKKQDPGQSGEVGKDLSRCGGHWHQKGSWLGPGRWGQAKLKKQEDEGTTHLMLMQEHQQAQHEECAAEAAQSQQQGAGCTWCQHQNTQRGTKCCSEKTPHSRQQELLTRRGILGNRHGTW